MNIAKLPELLRRDDCLAAGSRKHRVTLTGHEQVAVLHNKAFPSDLTKIKAGKAALREFITTRRRRLPDGSQGGFKLKYDPACSVGGVRIEGGCP